MNVSWNDDRDRPFRRFLSKVPEMTAFFWIIKILTTPVGQTFADFLSGTLRLGLTLTTVVTSTLLAVAIVAQFRVRHYVPGLYWLVVALISIVGTLVTDNLTDNFGVPLEVSAAVFAVILAATFAIWHATEKTLSIHTIDTPRREAFYWLTVLVAFALATTAGDLVTRAIGFRYAVAAVVFAALTAIVWAAHRFLGLSAVVTFWIAYVATRPLGATLGDQLAQPRETGGLGLGTAVTSVLFLATILAVITYLSITRQDQPSLDNAATRHTARPSW